MSCSCEDSACWVRSACWLVGRTAFSCSSLTGFVARHVMSCSPADLEELTHYVPLCPILSDQEPASCVYYYGGSRHGVLLNMLQSIDLSSGLLDRAEHRYGQLLLMCVIRRRNLMKRAFHILSQVRSVARRLTVWKLRHPLSELILRLVCQFASLSMSECLSHPSAAIGTYRTVSLGTVVVHFE